jgi:hypothetical protein
MSPVAVAAPPSASWAGGGISLSVRPLPSLTRTAPRWPGSVPSAMRRWFSLGTARTAIIMRQDVAVEDVFAELGTDPEVNHHVAAGRDLDGVAQGHVPVGTRVGEGILIVSSSGWCLPR